MQEPLVPAERNPKAIFITVLCLIGIMVGGIFVTKAYIRLLKRQQTEFRPEYKKRLQKNFQMVRHDREAVSLDQLVGKIWLAAPFVSHQPESGQASRDAMVAMASEFSENEDVIFLLLAVSPETDSVEKMQVFAQGHELTLPQWWLVGAEGEKIRKFMKNELRFGIFPHQENEVWEFDTSVVIVDRQRHIRGHFDFDRAAIENAKYVKAKGKDPGYPRLMLERLQKTIDYLLTNDQ